MPLANLNVEQHRCAEGRTRVCAVTFALGVFGGGSDVCRELMDRGIDRFEVQTEERVRGTFGCGFWNAFSSFFGMDSSDDSQCTCIILRQNF
ncbi:hypothetical protein K0M31_011921 [Melipona bicolor]|uniref:Uncharacterized protein n=1 Tax=Melipona bicolor TaxID=60889 RepID=A0AA40GAR6_9HYME|nr:hypothetical protein K0M31_011921 [Melipona bicolor]